MSIRKQSENAIKQIIAILDQDVGVHAGQDSNELQRSKDGSVVSGTNMDNLSTPITSVPHN